jgi:hypothetical protein
MTAKFWLSSLKKTHLSIFISALYCCLDSSRGSLNLKSAIISILQQVLKMRVTKEVIVCLVIGAILVFFGTSVKSYIFEALAIVVIAFGVILAVFWDDLFKTNNKNKEEKRDGEKDAIVV